MSRKHLEEAILAGQMIEHGMQPVFRFTTVETHAHVEPSADPNLDDVGIFAVQFTSDGQWVAVGAANSSVRVARTTQPSSVVTIKPSRYKHGFPITCLRYLPPQHEVLMGCSPAGEVYILSVEREGFEVVLSEPAQTYCFDLSPEGRELATAGRDGKVRVYSVEAADGSVFKPIQILKGFQPSAIDYNLTGGHGMSVFGVRYHPDKFSLLFTTGWDNDVKIWDTRMSGGPARRLYGPHVCGPDGLDIRGDEVLTGSWTAENALQIWDLRMIGDPNKPRPAATVPVIGPAWQSGNMSTEYLYCARFGDNGTLVVAGSGFNSVRVVERRTAVRVGEVPCGSCVHALDTIFGGRQIVAGSMDGYLSLARMR